MHSRVLVAGPLRMMREGLQALLHGSGEFHVVGQAATWAEAMRLCASLQPDILLLQPGESFRDLTSAEFTPLSPSLRVVILAGRTDGRAVLSAVRTGARAVLPPGADSAELLEVLRRVAAGQTHLPQGACQWLMACMYGGRAGRPAACNWVRTLTRREREVLRLASKGHTSRQIAAQLDLSVETVRSYRKAAMRKAGVSNLVKLILAASAAGLLQDSATACCNP